tara:strand:- start:968 stop:1441 length:474 start_codon:yes stop_codon:yes gene_type:complete
MEKSLLIIKPDGLQRNLFGEIINRFLRRGFKLLALKMTIATKDKLDIHYQDLVDKPYYPSIVEYMTMGPIIVFILEGLDAIKTIRTMLGETNPISSKPGTIRGDLCLEMGRNLCHASDSISSANTEINIWFNNNEIINYNYVNHDLIYRDTPKLSYH